MKIQIRNLGPIKKGSIDLSKRFYVFVGYNNSGKTYTAQLLWSMFVPNIWFDQGYEIIEKFDFQENKISSELTPDIIHSFFKIYADNITKKLLPANLKIEKNHFILNKFDIELKFDAIEDIKKKNFEAKFNNDDAHYIFKKEGNSYKYTLEREIIKGKANDFNEDELYLKGICKNFIYSLIFSEVHSWPFHLPFFLPANRSFFPPYYKYIYSVAKQEKDKIDESIKSNEDNDLKKIKALSKSPFTLPIDNLIEKLYNLNNGTVQSNFYPELLEGLKDIIGGEIIEKSSEGIAPIEFLLKIDENKDLDMYLSSASSNQLALLYLYLKYWAHKEGNILIIDEPEENLHPKNQIALVNLLMKFADMNNNRVLINTHSPIITETVNLYANLCYLKENKTDINTLIKKDELDLIPIENLSQKDFGIYFFNGKEIIDYKLNEYGIYFNDFKKEEEKIRNVSDILKDHIYNTLHK